MHEQTARLFAAAQKLHGLTEPHQLAKKMHVSQQTLKNWETRGMSDTGLLDAEEYLGCSAIWLRTGRGDMCKGLIHCVREERPAYDIPLEKKATYVIDGIRGLLHLGGYPADRLGTTPILRATLMQASKPALFTADQIKAAVVETWQENREELPWLQPEQIAVLLIDKMSGWIETQPDQPAPTTPEHEKGSN